MKAKELYDQDFFEWTVRNAQLLREGQVAQADIEHIAEELEDVGKRDQREVRNRLKRLLTHLLKWQVQPQLRSSESGRSSWLDTIREQRSQLADIFEQSPSLERYGRCSLSKIFCKAVDDAMYETRLTRNHFEDECPFSFDQIMDSSFLP